jgi:lactate permease
MTEGITALHWAAAATPIGVLLLAVMRGLKGLRAALLALGAALVVAATIFESEAAVLSVAVQKGLWLGGWIALVVGPAVLLYGIVRASGWERIGGLLSSTFPRRADRLLAVAWLLPSLIQSVAGFGTPLAIATPLLLSLGWRLPAALGLPLIGYHWSVTFGSMGSSYFMASFTARLGPEEQTLFAGQAAAMLGCLAILAGAVVLWLDGRGPRLREGLPVLLGAGSVLVVALVVTAMLVPALASLAASSAALVTALAVNWARSRRHRLVAARAHGGHATEPRSNGTSRRDVVIGTLPYAYLLGIALVAYGIRPIRRVVEERWVLAPDFPATVTGLGWRNEPISDFTPLPLLGHPGTFVLVSTTLATLTYLATRVLTWPDVSDVLRTWSGGLFRAVTPILTLATLAMVMVDSAMITTLATGLADITGNLYPLAAPWIGALGSFLTGSTTTSNALFSSLQADAADALGMNRTLVLAAQTVGGNIGNALSPLVILVGLASAQRPDEVNEVSRFTRWPIFWMLVLTSLATAGLTLLG